ncbi:hypothetical protein GCM10028787_32690 [Brachybacterium horti]
MQRATVINVMIASPSDISEARQAVYDSLAAWNDSNTLHRNVILLPRRWETSAVPKMGYDAQEVINQQLVDDADIVIAIFGSRLGRETARELSGTAEEMKRAHAAGKPVHTYFSSAPIPHDVNVEELGKLRDFKSKLEGLYAEFVNTTELNSLIWAAIEHDVAQIKETEGSGAPSRGGVDFLVQPGYERLPKTDSRGRLKYETKRWVEITNRGEADAEGVMVKAVEGGNFWLHWPGPTTVQHGQTRQVNVQYSAATSRAAISVTWIENGQEHSREFDIK